MERRIKKRIHEFDFISLLRVLEYLGYAFDEIIFKSHISTLSQIGLFQSIEFSKKPIRQIFLSVNLGLLGPQSYLPSYFNKIMDRGDFNSDAFVDFIDFFNHYLIQTFFLNLYPEINSSLISDWELNKNRYVKMADLKSPKTLHLIFKSVFPELEVKVKKREMKAVIETSFPKIGISVLGDDAVFGKKIKIPVHGIRITLISEMETYGRGLPWPVEIQKRLDQVIFPILKNSGLNMEIILVIPSQLSWAKLEKESYLGYDRIRGGNEQFRRIRIFRGTLSLDQKTVLS